MPFEPDPVFSPPPPPISASPMRQRADTPRDFLQSPTYTVNHNVHHPPASQSPFMPIPHPRIRTESLSSMKSIPANLQPRKKFRNEDQKIIDNKRESRERLSNKNVEKSQLRMFDMIYYNPSTNPMATRASTSERIPEEKEEKEFKRPITPPPVINTSVAVPQLRLNAQGELVLDESSLVVENEEHRKNRILLANTNVVYYDELSANYGFYKRQKRTKEWSHEETVKFYRCLNTVGTDFSLMLNLFPNRTRRDLKLKFKKEEKNNPGLVDKALLKFNSFDIEELQRELEKEEEEKKKESDNGSSEVKEIVKRKILKKQEAKAKAQQKLTSKVEKILGDGNSIISYVDANANKLVDAKENLIESVEKAIKRMPAKRKAPKPNIDNFAKKIKRNVDETQTSSTSIFAMDDAMPIEMFDSGIKMENCDLKKEEKKTFDVIQETMLDSVDSIDWTHESDLITPVDTEEDGAFESLILNDEPASTEYMIYDPTASTSQHKQELIYEPVEEPIEKPADTAFDEESFLESLNLEQLSIVVRHINGENFYEVYETDPVTQLISDKPLNLPPHIKDVLISVMAQDD